MEDLISFLSRSPSSYHLCNTAKEMLTDAGFTEIDEDKKFPENVKKGFIIRDNRAIIAFDNRGTDKAIIVTSNSDFPCFKIGHQEEQLYGENMVHLDQYGKFRCHEFIDRGLRIAGEVALEKDNKIEAKLFDSKKAACVIPGIAVHFNKVDKYNPKFDMIKEGNASTGKKTIKQLISKELCCEESEIKSYDLFLSDSQAPTIINDEILAAGRLANQAGCYAAIKGLIEASKEETKEGENCTRICAIFDRANNWSDTPSGANSTFLEEILKYLFAEKLDEVRAKSLHVSCQTTNANHPAYAQFATKEMPIYMKNGVVVNKSFRSDKATDEFTKYIVQKAAKKLNIPVQVYQPRNMFTDSATYETNIATNQGIRTVEIGFPVLSRGNPRETASVKDLTEYMVIVTELLKNYSSNYYIDV